MSIRDAILKAADHIERNPGEFSFSSCSIPRREGCGTPGCAIGWIAAFSGEFRGQHLRRALGWFAKASGIGGYAPDVVFYNRMSEVTGQDWIVSNMACAEGLRRYADKYHPAETANFARDLAARLASMPEIVEA